MLCEVRHGVCVCASKTSARQQGRKCLDSVVVELSGPLCWSMVRTREGLRLSGIGNLPIESTVGPCLTVRRVSTSGHAARAGNPAMANAQQRPRG